MPYYELPSFKQKILDKARACYETARLHPSNVEMREKRIENMGFYEGDEKHQWRADDLKSLADRRQNPMTINLVQGFIDALSGVEVQSRYRVACRADTDKESDQMLAEAATHLLYYLQEENSIPYKGSIKFRDALISGIGWSRTRMERVGKTGIKYVYDNIDPYRVFPDPEDLTPQYTNMKYICVKHWLHHDTVVKNWPKVGKFIDFEDPEVIKGLYSAEILDRQSAYSAHEGESGHNNGKIPVIEVQRKIEKKSYSGIDINQNPFKTFSEEKAYEIAYDKKYVEEINSTQIMKTVFTGHFLLENAPLEPNIPDLEDFSYVPFVWKRKFKNGTPYGVVDSIKDLQRDANLRITQSLHLINSSSIIIQDDALQAGMDEERFRKEMKQKDRVIIGSSNSDIKIHSNAELSDSHLKILDIYVNQMFQRATGVHDEMLGVETNATSGVAQKIRQVNSVRNNVFAFDNFAEMKKREALFLLKIIQASEVENLAVSILSEEEQKQIKLNRQIVRRNGEVHIENNISNLPMSLYIEEVPDFRSSFEEDKNMLESVLNNQNAMFILSAPELLRRLGFRKAQKLAQEMQEVLARKMAMENGQQPMQQTPSPSLTEHPDSINPSSPEMAAIQ